MPTFHDSAKNMLVQNGMFDADAETVINAMMKEEEYSNMRNRWHEDTGNYPWMLLNVIMMQTHRYAYKWICENTPQAWFRPLFSPGAIGLSGSEITAYLDQYEIEHPDWKIATQPK